MNSTPSCLGLDNSPKPDACALYNAIKLGRIEIDLPLQPAFRISLYLVNNTFGVNLKLKVFPQELESPKSSF